MTTALAIPANWYPDPSGRAQARYWDGRMWTAHVVRDGETSLDPLDGIQRPREPATPTPGVTPTSSGPTVGHGTQALQEMAAARPVPSSPRAPFRVPTGEPRIGRFGAVSVLLAAILVVGVGVVLYGQGALTVDSEPTRVHSTRVLRQPSYELAVPIAWPAQDAAKTLGVDGVWMIPDAEPVSVVVSDVEDASIADASRRDASLAFLAGLVAGTIDPSATLAEARHTRFGGHHSVVAQFTVAPSGDTPRRLQEYVIAQGDRAVIIAVVGTSGALARHVDAIEQAARGVRFR